MSMDEFGLIERFFKAGVVDRSDVRFGIGDDAACLQIPSGYEVLVSTDTLVAGVHFLTVWDGFDIASKAVRVNLSDMAAMAAEPCWISLALTLPEYDEHWLTRFSQGLHATLKRFGVALIGGDMTKGSLSMTLSVQGIAPAGKAVRRSGAKPSDYIVVSGCLGAAGLALEQWNKPDRDPSEHRILMQALHHPVPRLDLLPFVRAYATSCIDLSDGLGVDLAHILQASKVGAMLEAQAIPVHPLVKRAKKNEALDFALSSGDDYALCFTLPQEKRAALPEGCVVIGQIQSETGMRLRDAANQLRSYLPQGYKHF